ncbi:MAG: phosphoribosylformylglycinamidine cyclo-ligase [Chloroflexi bacterium]|nr:phosphoribosylformylglycinamidine cyclo-ligase [Chloroflexota bacterium]
MSTAPRSAYADAGVDLDHNDSLKAALRTAVASTSDDASLPGFGAFAGGLRLPADLSDPVLLASTDSLGTKLLLALDWDRPELAGGDIVRHCMNDLAVQNVRPLAFLDYVAAAHLERDVVTRLVRGIAQACRAEGVALIGGESAQLPDTYRSGAYDLAGTVIGVAEQADLASPDNIREGDVCVGLPAAGPHTNGYSLVRRALERGNPMAPLGETTVIEAALTPHESYVAALLRAFQVPGVHAAAHITGGGLIDNLPRVLPDGLAARLSPAAWAIPPLYAWIQKTADVTTDEMYRVFNMGVGVIVVCRPDAGATLLAELPGAFAAGTVAPRDGAAVELIDA